MALNPNEGRPAGLLSPLQQPAFRRLWFAGFAGSMGRWTEVLVLGWVALSLTDSVWLVAVAGFMRHVPVLILSAAIGSAADRFGRGPMLRAAMALNATVCIALAAASWLDALNYPTLVSGALLLGVGLTVEMTARRALLADLSTPAQLLSAVSLEMLTLNATRVFGPILAGALLSAMGGSIGYAVAAVFYGASAAFLWTIRASTQARSRRGEPGPNPLRVLRTLLSEPAVVGVLVVTVVMNVLVFPYQHILAVFARDTLDTGAFGFGLLSAADALGSTAGILLLSRVPQAPQGWVFLGASLLMPALLIAFSQATAFPVALVILLVFGLSHSGFSTMQSGVILHAAPPELRGRAGGWLSMAIGTGPVGLLGVGFVAAVAGPALAVTGAAASALVLIAVSGARLAGFRRYRW